MPKACDACQVTAALVFCKADAAYLCGNCDSKVHGANKLASRHERVWMCEVCEMAPAAITCKADAAALCPACDRDIHSANPLARRHERVPITPFIECPSMIKVAHIQPSVNAHLMPDASGLLQGGLFDGMAGLEENAEADEEGEGREGGDDEGDDETTAAEAATWILSRPGGGLPQRPAASNASDPLPRSSPVLPNLSLGMATLGMFASPYQQLPHRSLSEPGVGPGMPHHHHHHHHHHLALAKGMGFSGKLEPVTSNPDLNFDIDPFLDVEKMAGASAAMHAASLQGAHGAHMLQGLGVKDSLVPDHSHARASPSISNNSSYDTLLRKKFSLANEGQFPSLSEAGVVPEGADISSGLGDGLAGGLSFDKLPSSARLLQLSHLQPLAREARVMRYREKKKTRKFEKTIRYASRKAYAESRPRIKGRFAKRGDNKPEASGASTDGGSFCQTEASVGVGSGFH